MRILTSIILFCLTLLPVLVHADVQKIDDLDINYSVVTADTLSPQIAKVYGISRSKNRLLLTVVASRTEGKQLPQPVGVNVSAYAVNMAGQLRQIKMRSINEGKAIYYIGDFGYESPDRLRFTLNIAEPGVGKPYKIEFQRDF